MPTPVAAIIDGAAVLGQSYVATSVVWGYISLFVAFTIGVALAFRLARKVKGLMGR